MSSAKKPIDSEEAPTESRLTATREARKQHAIALLREYMATNGLSTLRRKTRFVKALGTTTGQLHQIMQGQRLISVKLAVNLDRISDGALPMDVMCVEYDDSRAIDWDHIRTAMRRRRKVEINDAVPAGVSGPGGITDSDGVV